MNSEHCLICVTMCASPIQVQTYTLCSSMDLHVYKRALHEVTFFFQRNTHKAHFCRILLFEEREPPAHAGEQNYMHTRSGLGRT